MIQDDQQDDQQDDPGWLKVLMDLWNPESIDQLIHITNNQWIQKKHKFYEVIGSKIFFLHKAKQIMDPWITKRMDSVTTNGQ